MGTRSNTPVFCDESGVRSVVLQWGGRGIALLLLLLCAGLALTLETRVEVPGLSRLLPTIQGSSELFDAATRRNGPGRQLEGEGKVMVPEISKQTVARVRDLPVRKPASTTPTVEPVAERPTATQAPPTATTPAAPPSAARSVQASPTRGPSPTASPIRSRNANAAVPRVNPNPQGPAANPPGQVKGKGKDKPGSTPSPETGVEPITS